MAMDESVISMVFSKEGDLLISGSTDGKIAVRKKEGQISPTPLQGHHSPILLPIGMESTVWVLQAADLTGT